MGEVGKEVRRLREARGWGQTKLAAAADMAVSGVSQIENGHRNPNSATLIKLARALGVEVADLFPKAALPLPFEVAAGAAGEGPLQGPTAEEALSMSRREFGEYVEGLSSRELLDLIRGPMSREYEESHEALRRAREAGIKDLEVFDRTRRIHTLQMIAIPQLDKTAEREEQEAREAIRAASAARAEAEAMREELEAVAG